MAIVNRQKVWIYGDVLTASDLNNEFSNIVTALDNNLNSDNLGTLETLVIQNTTVSPALIITSTTGNALEIG